MGDGARILSFLIFIIFILGFVSAVEGSFKISSNESAKYPQLPSKQEPGKSTNPQTKEFCEPDWQCQPWSKCIDFSKSRLCTDVNFCEIPSEQLRTSFCLSLSDETQEFLRKESPIPGITYEQLAYVISGVFIVLIIWIILKIVHLIRLKPKLKQKKLKHKIRSIKSKHPRH